MKKIYCLVVLLLLIFSDVTAQPFIQSSRDIGPVDSSRYNYFNSYSNPIPFSLGSGRAVGDPAYPFHIHIDRINGTKTPTELIEGFLLKDVPCAIKGVISNVTFDGLSWDEPSNAWKEEAYFGSNWQNLTSSLTEKAMGYLSNGSLVGFDQGILLTTGPGIYGEGPMNNMPMDMGFSPSGFGDLRLWGGRAGIDPDLVPYTMGTQFNKTILEFDFIAYQSEVSFNYVFLTTELAHVSILPDPFAILISGPGIIGINGQENIAKLPSGENVDAVNLKNNPSMWTQYAQWNGSVFKCQFTNWFGGSKLLTARRKGLQVGAKYTIKFSLGNVNDIKFGSAVAIQAGTFDIGLGINHKIGNVVDTNLYVGCDGKFAINIGELGVDKNVTITCADAGSGDCGLIKKPDGSPLNGSVYTIPANTRNFEFLYQPLPHNTPSAEFTLTLTPDGCGTYTRKFKIQERPDFALGAFTHFCSPINGGKVTATFAVLGTGVFEYAHNHSGTIGAWAPLDADKIIKSLPAGTYNIYIRNVGSCDVSNFKSVTIYGIPATPAVTTKSVCVGDPSPAITSLVTSTPPANCITQWFDATGTNEIPTPTFTTTMAGTQTYQVAYKNSTSACVGTKSTVTLTVNALPVVTIEGNASACAGSTANIYTTEAGKANYVWTVTNGTITAGGTVTSPTATVTWGSAGVGTITVSYKDANSCTGTLVKNITVNASPVPTISGPGVTPACQNTPTLAFNTESGMTAYDWTASGGGVITGQGTNSITVVWASGNSGTVTVNYTNGNGCRASTPTSQTVSVNPLPVITNTTQTICHNGKLSILFTATPSSGVTFTWTSSNNASTNIPNSGSGARIPASGSITVKNTELTVKIVPITVIARNTATGCIQTKTFNIEINPNPDISDASYDAWHVAMGEVCNGVSVPDGPIFESTLDATPGTHTFSWTVVDDSGVANSGANYGVPNGSGNYFPSFIPTNNTNEIIQLTVKIVAKNIATTCQGGAIDMFMRIYPTPKLTSDLSINVCNETAFTYTCTTAGSLPATFNWERRPIAGVTGGLGAGTGAIINHTLKNNTAQVIDVIYDVTSTFIGDGSIVDGGCSSTEEVIVRVNPTPKLSSTLTPLAICSGTAFNYTPASATTGATFSWIRVAHANGTGSSSGSGIGTINETLTSNTNTPITVTYKVTTSINGCDNIEDVKVVVNPKPVLTQPSNQTVCAGKLVNAINFAGNMDLTASTWTNNTPGIGLAASGTGNIAGFTAINAGNTAITATITVTPKSAVGCVGATQTFTITVNPAPVLTKPADQIVCAGGGVVATNFAGDNVSAATCTWTNNNTSIGLAADGTGNITNFTAVNAGTTTQTATITVTPLSANGCVGDVKTFTIKVNPKPSVNNLVANTIACGDGMVTFPAFTSTVAGASTFTWTCSNVNIASVPLAPGAGNIPNFTAVNTGTLPIIVNFTVKATSVDNCDGDIQSFTLTVNPQPKVTNINALTKTVCAGSTVSFVNFATSVTSTVAWSCDKVNIAPAPLGPGSGNIPSFVAVNNTSAPIVATFTVKATSSLTCEGVAQTFTLTINPKPVLTKPADQTVCVGELIPATSFVGDQNVDAATSTWSNDNTSIGLAANGAGNIAGFTALNVGSTVQTATITVTPKSADGCEGAPQTFTIKVNPKPAVTNVVTTTTVCGGKTVTFPAFTSAVTGATFVWTCDNVNIASTPLMPGAGNIPSFTAVNTSNAAITVNFTVKASAATCDGDIQTFTLIVDPQPQVTNIAALTQTVCGGSTVTLPAFVSNIVGGTFTWTCDNVNIASVPLTPGAGNIVPQFTAVNNTSAAIVATFTVTATSPSTCVGTAQTFTLTVNPKPAASIVGSNMLCPGSSTLLTATSTVAGSTFEWYQDGVLIPGENAATYSVTAEGDYQVVAIANACRSEMSALIHVQSIPAATPAITGEHIMCDASTLLLTAVTTELANTYQWYLNGNAIVGATANTYTVSAIGSYTLTVTPAGKCMSAQSAPHIVRLMEGSSFSDGNMSYGRAEHKLGTCIYLGNLLESKAQPFYLPSITADNAQNDDGVNGGAIDQIGGFTNLSHTNFKLDPATGVLTVKVKATNTSAIGANMIAWIDWNRNGVYDANEASSAGVVTTVPSGTSDGEFELKWNNAHNLLRNGTTYLRIRITNQTLTAIDAFDIPGNPFTNGEVEDYALHFKVSEIVKTTDVTESEIGKKIRYTFNVHNYLPTAVSMNMFDPIPAHTRYVPASANTVDGVTGQLQTLVVGGQATQVVQWSPITLPAMGNKEFYFDVWVINLPPIDSTVYNVAYGIKGADTITSGALCNTVPVQILPLKAGDDCGITLLNTMVKIDIKNNDHDPDRVAIVETKILQQFNGTSTVVNDSIVYTPTTGWSGLDSIQYQIKVANDSTTAWVRVAVVETTKERFSLCHGATGNIGVKPIEGVNFVWYKKTTGTSFITGNPITITMGARDTVFYLGASITVGAANCVTNWKVPIPVYYAKSPVYPDIRVQTCPLPYRTIKLSSYLDTMYFQSVHFTAPASLPSGALSSTGDLLSQHVDAGTYGFTYKVTNECGEGTARLYLSQVNDNLLTNKRTIVVCHDFAEALHLQQILGLDFQEGTWHYNNQALISSALGGYIKTAVRLAYAGALIFDGKSAYQDGIGTAVGTDRVIKLIYKTNSASCLNTEVELNIRLTNNLLQ